MRLNHYLIEGFYEKDTRTVPISMEDAFLLIDKHCMDAVRSKWHMYRGTNVSGIFFTIDPYNQGEVRVSPYADKNYYNLLLSNLPSWKSYPKRNRSVICSMNYGRASGYGIGFMMLPYDGSKIGVCPTNDIWGSFSLENLNVLNRILSILFDACKIKHVDTYIDLVKATKTIDEMRDSGALELELTPRESNLAWDLLYITKPSKGNKPLLTVLDQFLNPNKNGFELVTPGSGSFSESADNEVWTSGKCVMVNMETWSDSEAFFSRYQLDKGILIN